MATKRVKATGNGRYRNGKSAISAVIRERAAARLGENARPAPRTPSKGGKNGGGSGGH